MPSDKTLTVFNLQRYSLHDGSGIRTTVFLKGCPMRCRWCCNPESQLSAPQIMYSRSKCIGKAECGFCKAVCPAESIAFDEQGTAVIDFSRCTNCLQCAAVCPSTAIKVSGKVMTVDEIMELVAQDAVFFNRGAGGLTLSGGEPLMQENAVVLLKAAKENYLQTAVETCGCVPTERLLEASRCLDEVFFDLKSMDDDRHRPFTGCSNRLILENLTTLCAQNDHPPITVRTPVIPGFNDDAESLRAMEAFVKTLPGNVKYERLPYHTYGVGKYTMLGREYQL